MQTPDGRLVQVKATQKANGARGVGLGRVKRSFDYLLVFEFDETGNYEVLYNGPGSYIDEARAHKAGAGLTRLQLRKCQAKVPTERQLRVASLGEEDHKQLLKSEPINRCPPT